MKHELKVNVPEGVKERTNRVKQHLQENKTTYLVGAGCLAAGYFLRKPQVITVISEGAAPVFNNTPLIAPVMNNIVHNTVNNGGYSRKIIRCVETDELWPSMSKAAEAAGHTLQAMSRHIHGYNDHLDGLHYVIEGVTAS